MDQPNLTQQTSTVLSLPREMAHEAPAPRALRRDSFAGPLQWLLEGRGWAVLLPTIDLTLSMLAVVMALGGPGAVGSISSRESPLLLMPLVILVVFRLRGLYRSRLRSLALDEIVPVLSGISIAAMAVATIGALLNGGGHAELHFVRTWVFSLVAVAFGRVMLSGLRRRARALRLVGKPVLIVGAGMVGAQVARRLNAHPEYGLVPIGFLDEDPLSVAEVGGRDVPVLGSAADLEVTVARTGVKHVIVAFSSVADAQVSRLVQHCQELGMDVSVVPRMFDTINNRAGYDNLGGLPLLSFSAVNPSGVQFAVKHALDQLVALALLVVLSPLIVCAALAVRLSSPGPVFFKQRRVGRDGQVFDLYKFRSMRSPEVADAEPDEAGASLGFLLAAGSAPGGVEGVDRRTAVGRLMRRTSVDELPQLFNVLRGEMSLVGPRPERPEFVELFRQDIERYGDRTRVRAGITGWAQVHGLRGQTSLTERVEWDNYYIAHWSLGLDLKIIALTLVALFHDAE